MRVPELPHMRELPAGLRDLTLQLPHLGELPNPHKHWVFGQLPHFPLSSRPVPGHSSRGVRDRTGQAAFLRSARAGPSTQVGWRQVKVSSTFSKGRYVPVGRCPAADRAGRRDQTPGPSGVARGPGARWAPFRTDRGGSRDPKPPPSPTSKKGGTDVPLLGCHRARGFCLWKGQARCHRARSRGYLLRSVRPRPLHFFLRLRRLRP